MEHINNVCDYLIVKLCEGGGYLNVLKLHKLLYYVQAWNLAFSKGRLFDGEFQAWIHGPVSREIYDRYPDKSIYSPVNMGDVAANFNPQSINAKDRAAIDSVLEIYGQFTGDQLEEMTHQEAPWINARNGIPPNARCENIISDHDMRHYYASRLSDV